MDKQTANDAFATSLAVVTPRCTMDHQLLMIHNIISRRNSPLSDATANDAFTTSLAVGTWNSPLYDKPTAIDALQHLWRLELSAV
jgi:hypothetical protein